MSLFLADLGGKTEDEVREHIAENYRKDYTPEQKHALRAAIDGFDVLVAYESVGDYGCDSASWFLLRDKRTGTLYENHAGHCSCYGFEGQWSPEEVTVEHILSDKFYMPVGGYDDAESDERRNEVVDWVRKNLSADPAQTSLL